MKPESPAMDERAVEAAARAIASDMEDGGALMGPGSVLLVAYGQAARAAIAAYEAAKPVAVGGEAFAYAWRHVGEKGWRFAGERPFNPGIEVKPLYDVALPRLESQEAARSAEAVDEMLLDKIEGLEADLESAVEVAFRRGATEWTRLNYPKDYARLTKPEASDV